MNRILIVDGHNLLFQMFYGMPARITNSLGKAIQGTLGFVGALLKMIRAVQPTHVFVAFDGECENARTEIDSDYKANRPDLYEAWAAAHPEYFAPKKRKKTKLTSYKPRKTQEPGEGGES